MSSGLDSDSTPRSFKKLQLLKLQEAVGGTSQSLSGCVVDHVATGSRPSRSMQCALDWGVHSETVYLGLGNGTNRMTV